MRSAVPRTKSMDKYQEPYVRNRDHPYFYGIRKGDPVIFQGPNFDIQENVTRQNSVPSSSKSDDLESSPTIQDVPEDVIEKARKPASSILLLETYGRSLSGRHTEALKPPPGFSFPNIQSDSDIDLNECNDLAKEPVSRASETNEGCESVPVSSRPMFERSYSIIKKSSEISRIPVPQSAALFYVGSSPQIEVVESCESTNQLNQYLKARKEDIRVGVPGKFLHVIIGQELMDVGSAVSTILYAFYLNVTTSSSQVSTVPVINMKRAEWNSRAEIKWLFDSCYIDESSLIFIDEIDISYYYGFGSLKLVLLNGHKLPFDLEVFKEALVEIFNCKKGDSVYPWVAAVTTGQLNRFVIILDCSCCALIAGTFSLVSPVRKDQDCSCCTLIAEKFTLVSPEILAGRGFSRLMLAAILLDTGNLKNPQCTSKDKYMATLLINGAGRFGCNGLYQILKYKMYDISELRVGNILRKDFKKWTRVGKPDHTGSRLTVSHIGMSSVGISVRQLLIHEESATEEIVLFQQSEKLRLLMIVSGYYDSQKNFKREILVSAESVELMKNLLNFFNTNAAQLPLKVLHQPGLRDELRAFEIDNKITSRKTIERLLEEFGGSGSRR